MDELQRYFVLFNGNVVHITPTLSVRRKGSEIRVQSHTVRQQEDSEIVKIATAVTRFLDGNFSNVFE